MIECDGCNGWFHGKCIGLADRIAGKNLQNIYLRFLFIYLFFNR